MRLLALVVVSIFLFQACTDEPEEQCDPAGITQEEDASKLQALFAQIKELSESVNCENPADWSFTAYGSKPCGGPQGYIAYANDLDVESFLDLVKMYTDAEAAFNERWGAISDCAVVNPPSRVVYEEGIPILEN